MPPTYKEPKQENMQFLKFLLSIRAAPLFKDKNGVWKFKMATITTIVSYLIWCVIPVTAFFLSYTILYNNGALDHIKLNSIFGIGTLAILVNSAILPILFPYLMATLIEKSGVLDQDNMKEKTTKKTLITAIIIFHVLFFPLQLYAYSKTKDFSIICVLLTICIVLVVFLMSSNLMVINIIFNNFIEEAEEMNKEGPATVMIATALKQVLKLRRIKEGMNLQLFTMMPINGVFSGK